MKRIYKDSQQEIIRLKKENQDIFNALESCKRVFETGVALNEDSYRTQIDNLELEIHKLNQLNQEYQKGLNGHTSNAVKTLMEHYQNDTKTYKTKYSSCLQQKSSLEEMLSKCQQENARFQLEILELKTKLRAEKAEREKLETTKSGSTEIKPLEVSRPEVQVKCKDWREVIKLEKKVNIQEPILPCPSIPLTVKKEFVEPIAVLEKNKENTPCKPQYRDINIRSVTASGQDKKEPVTGELVAVQPRRIKAGFTVKTIKIPSKPRKPALSNSNDG